MTEKQAPKQNDKPTPQRTWSPSDDLYGNGSKPVDTDMDLDKGKFSEPPPKP